MSEVQTATPQVIDVRPIPKPQRHPLIFAALDALAVGASVIVHNDHDPIPLRGQVEALYGAQFAWQYLEAESGEFRLQFTRRETAPAGWNRPRSDAVQSTLPMAPPAASTCSATQVDLHEIGQRASHSGPQWGHESDDLDLTLLSWQRGQSIEAHVNREVDVVWVGVEGAGVVTIDGQAQQLRPGVAIIIPKGCERSVRSTAERLVYLSLHRRRRGLMPVNNLQNTR